MKGGQLTDAAARALSKRGDWPVGGVPGLELRVLPTGSKVLTLRYRNARGQSRRVTLGRYPDEITLARARTKAAALREKIRDGIDPTDPLHAEQPTIATAIAEYQAAAANVLQVGTAERYARAHDLFATWAASARVERTEQITRAGLVDFRAWLVARPKAGPKPGGTRGERRKVADKRTPVTINSELQAVKTLLTDLRRAGKLPSVDADAIADTLRALRSTVERPSFLAPREIDRLLHACLRHDAEASGPLPAYRPIAPFAAFLLLTGCRRGEALRLDWSHVDLEAADESGRKVGEVAIPAKIVKTRRARTVGLEVSPGLRRLLAAMQLRAAGPRLFDGYTVDVVAAARTRLVRHFGAPAFAWKTLRSTCDTFLINAPGIFGSAAQFLAAKQLGHSVAVSERHYAGLLRGISRDARSLEAAMRCEDVLEQIVARVGGSSPARRLRGVS